MTKCLPFFGLLGCFLCLSSQSSAQRIPTDSTAFQTSLHSTLQLYHQARGVHAHLYNGKEYVDFDSHIKGHQKFESEDWEAGSIEYDGLLYENIPMFYDLVKQEVVIQHYDLYFKIKLQNERITRFSLLDHTFIRLVADSTKTPVIRTGIYDQRYNGQVKMLVKRKKIIDEKLSAQGREVEFFSKDSYFLWKEGVYYSVKSKKSVMNVFKNQKKALQKYLRENRIVFNDNREKAMAGMAAYYDKLSQ